MLGGMFAGTEEAPGEVELYQDERANPIVAWVQSVQWRKSRALLIVTSGFECRLREAGAEGSRGCSYKGLYRPLSTSLWGAFLCGVCRKCASVNDMRTKPQFVRDLSRYVWVARSRCVDHQRSTQLSSTLIRSSDQP